MTFGTNGKISNTFEAGDVPQDAFAVVVQPNRFIVVAGYCRVGVYNTFCDVRYVGNRSLLDATFGGGKGFVTTQVAAGVNTRAYGLAHQPTGKILVTCKCGSVPCAVRYLRTGVLDISFSCDGIAGSSASVQPGGAGAELHRFVHRRGLA